MAEQIKFKIEHVDAMGQGVSKILEKVAFVKKTLPGESGTALVDKASKGVLFCSPLNIESTSPNRIDPICPHFKTCNGCHFLHTDYDHEIKFKTDNFSRLLERFGYTGEVTVHRNDRRTGYRNRIQLHYDLLSKKLGFMEQNKIVPVPHCSIAKSSICEKMKELYQGDNFLKILKGQRPKGHIEISDDGNGVKVRINERYAAEGFSQVNEYLNRDLLDLVNSHVKSGGKVIDLFGGKGNLSNEISNPTLVIDYTPYDPSIFKPHQTYRSLDIFKEGALQKLNQWTDDNVDTLIVDPPRSGFSNLGEYVLEHNFKTIIYISCNHSTQLRDITPLLTKFEISEAHIIDLFSSTYHFETALILSYRSA